MANSMRRNSYPPGETAAVLASSASMGITVPPSVAALVLASVSSISVGALFAAGLLPAAVLGLLLMLVIWLRARRLGLPAVERSSVREVAITGAKVIPGMGMMVILIGGILAGVATPTEVSTFGVVYGLVLAVLYRTLTRANLWRSISETSALVGMVLFLISAAHGFAWMLTVNQIPQQLGAAITDIPGGSVPFLIVSIALVMVLGSLFEGIPALLILAPILFPTALELGIDPVHYGVILIFSMGIGAFSPPIGVGFLLACAVSGATVEEGMRPYLAYFATLLIGTLLLAFVPWLTLVVPRILGT
jgi:tripartite ATP-independent transporter DctM subunit